MSAPGWLHSILAAAMIMVTLYHLARGAHACPRAGAGAAFRPRADLDTELGHAGMGLVMALMLLDPPAPADGRVLAWVFAGSAVWFLRRALHGYVIDGLHRAVSHVQPAVGCAAMAYMSAALVTGPSMAGMAMPSSGSVLPALLAGALVAAVLATAVPVAVRPGPPLISAGPGRMLATGCRLAMAATTVYLLLAG